jgi:hypothetical protein
MTVSFLDARNRFDGLIKRFYITEKKTAAQTARLTVEALTTDELVVLLDSTINEQIRDLDRRAAEAAAGHFVGPTPKPNIRNNIHAVPNAQRGKNFRETNKDFEDSRRRGRNLAELATTFVGTLNEFIYVPSLKTVKGDGRILFGDASFDEMEESKQYYYDNIKGDQERCSFIEKGQRMLVEFKIAGCTSMREIHQFIVDAGGEANAYALLETMKAAA